MPITAVDIERELSSKRRECDAIRERYKHLLIECGDLEYRIRDLRGPAASEPDLQAVPVTQPDAELVEPPDQSSAGLPVDVDRRGATDHVERFRRLGSTHRPGGMAHRRRVPVDSRRGSLVRHPRERQEQAVRAIEGGLGFRQGSSASV